MADTNLYIYTGPVHSGKTSRLNHWLRDQDNVAGILAPMINNKRHLRDLKTGDTRLLEAEFVFDEEYIVKIGEFSFYRRIFDWARNVLQDAYKSKPDWLIIDEAGKLELEGRGLEPEISNIVENRAKIPATNILVIVRENLLKEFKSKYSLTKNDYNLFEIKEEKSDKEK